MGDALLLQPVASTRPVYYLCVESWFYQRPLVVEFTDRNSDKQHHGRSRMRRIFICPVWLLFLAVIVYGTASTIPGASAQKGSGPRARLQQRVDFKRQIEPIFARNCYQCHGAKKAMGRLRLDDKESALKGGLSGVAIIPGDSKQSLLMKRILGEGDVARMPMGGAPLKPAEIAMIRQWINEGAGWTVDDQSAIPESQSAIKQHWAYVKPVLPALPRVKNQSWGRNPIDAFILAR